MTSKSPTDLTPFELLGSTVIYISSIWTTPVLSKIYFANQSNPRFIPYSSVKICCPSSKAISSIRPTRKHLFTSDSRSW